MGTLRRLVFLGAVSGVHLWDKILLRLRILLNITSRTKHTKGPD